MAKKLKFIYAGNVLHLGGYLEFVMKYHNDKMLVNDLLEQWSTSEMFI